MTICKMGAMLTSVVIAIGSMGSAFAYEGGRDHERMEQLRQKLQQDVQQMKTDQQKLSQDREKVRQDRMEMMRLHQDMMRDRMEHEGGQSGGQGWNNNTQRPQQGGMPGGSQ